MSTKTKITSFKIIKILSLLIFSSFLVPNLSLQAAPTVLNQVIITNKITNIPPFSSSKKRNDISVCFVPPINSGLPSAAAQEISNNTSIPIQNLQSEINYIVKVTPTRSGIDGSLLDPCNTAPLFTTITTFRQLVE